MVIVFERKEVVSQCYIICLLHCTVSGYLLQYQDVTSHPYTSTCSISVHRSQVSTRLWLSSAKLV